MAAEEQPTFVPPSHLQDQQASALSAWLSLMLAEIARKREDLEQARAEQLRRAAESYDTSSNSPPPAQGS